MAMDATKLSGKILSNLKDELEPVILDETYAKKLATAIAKAVVDEVKSIEIYGTITDVTEINKLKVK